jgi:hypothetical protein
VAISIFENPAYNQNLYNQCLGSMPIFDPARMAQIQNQAFRPSSPETEAFTARIQAENKAYERNNRMDRRVTRIKNKIAIRRAARIQSALYFVGWTWGVLIAIGGTIGLVNVLVKLLLG